MKLSKDYILHTSDGETILVPTANASFSGIVRGNKTLGAVLGLLREETTEAEIVDAMKKRFDAPKDTIAQDVRRVLDGLRKIGALEE
jgi:hypothetical protein